MQYKHHLTLSLYSMRPPPCWPSRPCGGPSRGARTAPAEVNRIVFRVINDIEAALVSFNGGSVDRIGLTPMQYQRQDLRSERFDARANENSKSRRLHLRRMEPAAAAAP